MINRGYQHVNGGRARDLRRAMDQGARFSIRTAWTNLITLSNGLNIAGVRYDDTTVPWDIASLVKGT